MLIYISKLRFCRSSRLDFDHFEQNLTFFQQNLSILTSMQLRVFFYHLGQSYNYMILLHFMIFRWFVLLLVQPI
jgi:hypothetical protein